MDSLPYYSHDPAANDAIYDSGDILDFKWALNHTIICAHTKNRRGYELMSLR